MSQGLTKLVEHSSDSGESSKWKLAVALGVPLVVVSGFVFYWYWRSKKRAKSLAGSEQSSAAEDDVSRTAEPVASKTKVRGELVLKIHPFYVMYRLSYGHVGLL